ncbi:MAG: hypothetical protein AB8G15_14355 [Saprospiraceae bacterium]
MEHEDINRQAIKVKLEPGTKDVKRAFKDYMEDEKGLDIDGFGFLTNKDVLKSEGQVVSDISRNKMDLFAKIVENGDLTEMYVFGSFGYDLHITPERYPAEYRKMRSLIYGFLNDYLPGYYQEKIEGTEDLIGDLKDDKEDAKDALADNRDEIEDLKKENQELSEKIKSYEDKLRNAEAKLNDRKVEKSKVTNKIKQIDK